ncbi:MAG: rhomboid family intramembrane serine protease [Chthonomonadales bacterium]
MRYPDHGVSATPPRRRAPWLTLAACGLCVLFTAAYWAGPARGLPILHSLRSVSALPPPEVWSGRYYSLLTSVFVHANLIHLAFDLLWLYALGTALEETMHPLAWLLFFVAAGIVGGGCELALTGHTAIGASGVDYAMFGLMWAGRRQVPRWRAIATPTNLNYLLIWGALCVVATLTHLMAIGNAAHAGGFLLGIAAGWLFIARRRRIVAALSLAGLLALTACSLFWMPWSGDWTEWKGDQAMLTGNLNQALRWYRRSIRMGQDPLRVLPKIADVQEQLGDHAGAGRTVVDWYRLQQARLQRAPRAAAQRKPSAPDELDEP